MKKVNGQIDVCDRGGVVSTYYLPVEYCEKCKLYFVLEEVYQILKAQGCLLCKIMKCEEYREQGIPDGKISPGASLRRESLLHVLGYNVGQPDHLTQAQRWVILERAVEKGVITQDREKAYLYFFIKNLGGCEAERKWISDMNHMNTYVPFSHDKNVNCQVKMYKKS